MLVRTMTVADIPAGMRLKEIAGWNQTEADWHRFLDASRDGCFVAEVNGAVCGTAATISFEGRFAWIGMVLVGPANRGRGIGRTLLEKSIAYLDSAGIPSIKLDATPAGKAIYEKLGFVTEYELERWTLERSAQAFAANRGSEKTERTGYLPRARLEQILNADREVFGADRARLLRSVHNSSPRLTEGIWNGERLEGYAFARRGSFADQLGPWVAQNEIVAKRLLERFLSRSTREVAVADCVMTSGYAKGLLQSCGFSYSRSLTRMYRGTNQYAGRPDLLCAILGPEFG